MQPVCVFIIIVLGFVALWLLLDESNPMPVSPEYYPSETTDLPPSTWPADVSEPNPHTPTKTFAPPRNPAFGAADRFMTQETKNKESMKEDYYQVPNPQWRYWKKKPTPQDYTAWNYLANRFFPTDKNTITDTMF